MATVLKTIGLPGPPTRDYASITLWEADLDVTSIYASGDDAIGELYPDANFNESFALNGGGTVGLVNKILRPAAGMGHTGTAGTGVRFVCSVGRNWVLGITNAKLYGIEFNLNGTSVATQAQLAIGSGPSAALPAVMHRLIVHDGVQTAATTSARYLIQIDTGLGNLQNSIVYNWTVNNSNTGAVAGFVGGNSSSSQRIINTTVHNIIRNTGSGTNRGVNTSANNVCRNVIVTGTGGTTSGGSISFQHSATGTGETHNLSDDAGSANATSSIINAVLANIYVSTVGGAEDLRLKAGSPAIDVGVDLALTYPDDQFDINNFDRDSSGVVWDIGAHEFVAATGAFSLTADPGSYDITGSPASTLLNRSIIGDPGSYVVTGSPASLTGGRATVALPGSYAITGNPATFGLSRVLPTDIGTYTLTGVDATLTKGGSAAKTTATPFLEW